VDEAGYLTVRGRKDNMFVSGGENIHPEQIEAVLGQMDVIRDALVVPVEDSEFGFRPAAFVRLVPKAKISKRELVERLESVLPRFKIPKCFFAWPQAESGDLKPSRRHFADLLRSGNVTELT